LPLQVWDYNATESELGNRLRRLGQGRWGDYGHGEQQAETLTPTVMAAATSANIERAKQFVENLEATAGKTNCRPILWAGPSHSYGSPGTASSRSSTVAALDRAVRAVRYQPLMMETATVSQTM
jgi:hypothetical protein